MNVCLFCTLTPDSVLIRPYNIMQTYIWWFYFVFFVHKNEFVLIKMTNSKVSNWEILRISFSNARDLAGKFLHTHDCTFNHENCFNFNRTNVSETLMWPN